MDPSYDEVWAVDAERVRRFFGDRKGDVTVMDLPAKSVGPVEVPQTRIIIRGEDADELYRRFFLHFISAGG